MKFRLSDCYDFFLNFHGRLSGVAGCLAVRSWLWAPFLAMLLAAPVFSQSGNAPSNLRVTVRNEQATLTWDAPTTDAGTVTRYEIAVTAKTDGRTRTFSFTVRTRNAPTTWMIGLSTGRIRYYTFKVRAMRNGAGSAWSNAVTIDTRAPSTPAAPSNLSASVGDGSVTLSWDNPNDNTITGYQYRYRKGATWAPDWTDISGSGASTTSHAISSLTNGTEHTFEVRAKNAGGNGASASVKATPTAPVTPVNPPAAPSNLRAKVGNASVTLSWNDPSDNTITGYQYRYRTGATWASDWTDISGSGASTTRHPLTGLTNGTEHTFEVRAKAGSVEGASASVTATPIAPPAAPTNLAATPGDESMNLSWNNPNDATITGYQYRYKTGASWDPDWTDIRNSGALTTSHLLTGLTNGTEHTFEVRAKNAGGDGASASVMATPRAPTTTPPPVVSDSLRIDSFTWTDSFGGVVTVDSVKVHEEEPLPTIMVNAAGGQKPYRYSMSLDVPLGPEDGLSILSGSIQIENNQGKGQISGTPTQAGTYAITVKVTDNADSTAIRNLTLRVIAPLRITHISRKAVLVDRDIDTIFVTTSPGRRPYSYSISGEPFGISINSDGQITGRPIRTGEYTGRSDQLGHTRSWCEMSVLRGRLC